VFSAFEHGLGKPLGSVVGREPCQRGLLIPPSPLTEREPWQVLLTRGGRLGRVCRRSSHVSINGGPERASSSARRAGSLLAAPCKHRPYRKTVSCLFVPAASPPTLFPTRRLWVTIMSCRAAEVRLATASGRQSRLVQRRVPALGGRKLCSDDELEDKAASRLRHRVHPCHAAVRGVQLLQLLDDVVGDNFPIK
jgi:hypothetical protein